MQRINFETITIKCDQISLTQQKEVLNDKKMFKKVNFHKIPNQTVKFSYIFQLIST